MESTTTNPFQCMIGFVAKDFRHDNDEDVQQRDEFKQEVCYANGITLIVVPYWWNRTKESIAKTVHMARPDILVPPELLKGDAIVDSIPKQAPQKGIIEICSSFL